MKEKHLQGFGIDSTDQGRDTDFIKGHSYTKQSTGNLLLKTIKN